MPCFCDPEDPESVLSKAPHCIFSHEYIMINLNDAAVDIKNHFIFNNERRWTKEEIYDAYLLAFKHLLYGCDEKTKETK